eukprot:TRINITY_DN12594_c0_g1_i3.p1 TRINITY_DN12594_c0_g1~~TRINITY_DN12594_c0_g1_i3.p1  ORF type:complete len:362 (+),score=68.84 TRINITY_DN12594_c0_g1_i3:411-1496(+)
MLSVLVLMIFVLVTLLEARNKRIPFIWQIAIFWLQIISLFAYFSKSWPREIWVLLGAIGIFNVDLEYFGLFCEQGHYSRVWVVKMFLPLGITFGICVHVVLSALIKKESLSLWKFWSIFLQVNRYFLNLLVNSSLQVFNCVDGGNGARILSAEPSLQCYGDEWTLLMNIDIGLILFYGVGVPFAMWKIQRDSHKNQEARKLYKERMCAAFYQGLRDDRHWFEMFRIGFSVIFQVTQVILPTSTPIQKICLQLCLMCFQWVVLKRKPYKEPVHNHLFVFWCVVSQTFLLSELAFSSSISAQEKWFIEAVCITSIVALLSFTLMKWLGIEPERKRRTRLQVELPPTSPLAKTHNKNAIQSFLF